MVELINKYFPDLPTEIATKIALAGEVYKDVNSRINLISRKDIDNIFEKHILHSLSIAKIHPLRNNTTLIDVGTGGGFPGIPLAIFFPEVKFYLNDSIAKKMRAVDEIISALQLKNVQTLHGRSEELKQKFDYVSGRAVTNFTDFYKQTSHLLAKKDTSEILYLKGEDVEAELIKSPFSHVLILNLGDYFEEEFYTTKRLVICKK